MGLLILLFIPAAFVYALMMGLLYRLVQHLMFRRGTVIAEYEAPHMLSAAELGYLVDRDFGDNEQLATGVALAGKGFLAFTKHESGNPLLEANEVKDYRVKELDDAEITIFSAIRNQRHRNVAWKDFSGVISRTVGARASFEHEVHSSLINKGYLSDASPFAFKSISKQIYAVAVLVLILIIGASYFFAMKAGETGLDSSFRIMDRNIGFFFIFLTGALVWLPLAYLLRLLYLAFYYAANQPIEVTDKFRKHWHDVAGFQLFIKTVEFSRLEADTNPYDEAMPYAIALGFKPDIDKMTELALRK